MIQAICDEPETEDEVERSDTSDDELIQKNDHDTELEQELNVEGEEIKFTEEHFLAEDKTKTWNKSTLTSKYSEISRKKILKIFSGAKNLCRKYYC